MWVAHGLIQLDGTTRPMEDVGERYLMDLLDRSFFEVHRSWRGTRYKMHDLIHDLAQSVGGDEYYNLESGAKCMVKSTRHAWVSGDKLTSIGHEGEKLHTLVVAEPCDEKKFNELTISTFQQLRVLRIRRLWLRIVPQFVGGLRHLYYLDLSRNDFVSLPESIYSLYNLQTLILSDCRELVELPAGIRDLGSLRCLDTGGCDSLRYMPRGLEELTCLQTLNHFVCLEEGCQRRNYAEVCELKSLVNLRGSLEIRNLRGSLANAKCETKRSCILVELKLIMKLELNWKEGQYEEELKEEEDSGVSLPNIVYIKLEFCWRLGHLPALGLLPSLQQLYLRDMHGVKYLIDSRSTLEEEAEELLFPSLKELHLTRMYQLKRVVEPTESSRNKRYFPVLEKLVIEDCPLFLADGSNEDGKLFASLREVYFRCDDIETLPSGLQYLPHLQILTISDCRKIVSLPDWMGNLTSLQELHLESCKSLASIPDCLQRLTSLQQLWIKGCTNLHFPFHGDSRIQTLPSGLQYLPHLQILTISDWPQIVSLPDWMGDLTSLQELLLINLWSLASIPDCLQSLTSLQRLLIKNCRTELVGRCKKKTGVDWHKIAHIPYITITIGDELYLLSDSESEESEDSSSPGEESKHQNEEHELLDLSLHL